MIISVQRQPGTTGLCTLEPLRTVFLKLDTLTQEANPRTPNYSVWLLLPQSSTAKAGPTNTASPAG